MSDAEKAVDATLDLASENQRLRERVAELEAEVPYVTDLHAANGQLDMTIQGAKSTLFAMATALAKSFEADGGINYVQYEVRSGDKDFVLTLQRAAGKTPHQLRQEAESRATKAETERDAALAQVAVLREALEGVGHWSEEEQARCWCGIPSMIPYRGHDGDCTAARAALASTPEPTRAEAEAWLRAGEPVRGALAVPAEPDYSGLCAAPSCEGHCGYVHARGCEAVREYLADHGGEPYRAPSKAVTP